MSAAAQLAPSVERDSAPDSASRLTKIVATIGPATNNAEALVELRAAGINMARLNLSHNDLDWHEATIAVLREVLPDTPILLDIPGRKIRTIQLAHEPSFAAGDVIILTTDLRVGPLDAIFANEDRQISGNRRFRLKQVDPLAELGSLELNIRHFLRRRRGRNRARENCDRNHQERSPTHATKFATNNLATNLATNKVLHFRRPPLVWPSHCNFNLTFRNYQAQLSLGFLAEFNQNTGKL